MVKIRRRQRCPNCGSLNIIRWGTRDCHLTLMYRSDYQIVTLRLVAMIWARTTDAVLLVQRPAWWRGRETAFAMEVFHAHSPDWRYKKGRHYLSTVAGNCPKRSRSAKNSRPGAQIGHWRILPPQVSRKMQTCCTLSSYLQRSERRSDSLYQGASVLCDALVYAKKLAPRWPSPTENVKVTNQKCQLYPFFSSSENVANFCKVSYHFIPLSWFRVEIGPR